MFYVINKILQKCITVLSDLFHYSTIPNMIQGNFAWPCSVEWEYSYHGSLVQWFKDSFKFTLWKQGFVYRFSYLFHCSFIPNTIQGICIIIRPNNQGICIFTKNFREYTYPLSESDIMHIPWKYQRIYIFPDYTDSL